DPTLLFTNAGMNQFKDIFLGISKKTRDYTRAVDTQKCIRVSGKHNDLEEVGRDTYHHTFFEMLGNWSFGDYFKKEAIEWAWDLLVNVFKIDPSKLYATVFGGDPKTGLAPDTEAEQLWPRVTGIPADRVMRFGKKDNFWEMGETGPCGPCSEIHIDLGPGRCDKQHVAGHVCAVNGGCARFVELWNLVFIQFDRRGHEELVPLPARHVDTGAGLERVTCLLQGKRSNYDTDLFTPILAATEALCGKKYTAKLGAGAEVDNAFRVIADHIRMLSFSIADGSLPSNDGRGYVQRRILRRAVRFGWQYLDLREPFMHKLVPVVGKVMGGAFPEVVRQASRITDIIREEEVSFLRTLDRGMAMFADAVAAARSAGHTQIDGGDAFRLYETYGFPIDLTQLMADEAGLSVDMAEYERRMEEHQAISAAGGKRKIDVLIGAPATDDSQKYLGAEGAGRILGLERGGQYVTQSGPLTEKDGPVGLVLDATCFYAEQGGQVGDSGTVTTDTGEFLVEDSIKVGATTVHVGQVKVGRIEIGQQAKLLVHPRRMDIRRNHTATHLLHWALHKVLGDHVQQAGSLVAHDRLRFDFNHNKAIAADQIAEIERLVNERVMANERVATQVMPIEQARQLPGVKAFFGEKYEDEVRVVEVGDEGHPFSREFCGGTHLDATGQIGLFKVVGEESVAKGVRRISAVTGSAALEHVQQTDRLMAGLVNLLRTSPDQIGPRIEAMQAEIKQLKKAKASGAANAVDDALAAILSSADDLPGGGKLCVGELAEATADQMRGGADWLRAKAKSTAVLLASRADGKITLIAGVSDDLVARGGHAGNWVKQVAGLVGGSGGGRP
ncbi:MAG: alanine--tRNA ligase, partial [Phycisphaerae bacterium]|nr:alanine--tRNA ligase [Phycisphaerae bacterium]